LNIPGNEKGRGFLELKDFNERLRQAHDIRLR
jgi:hypothetical protein